MDEPGEDTPTIHPLASQRVTARELIAIRRELFRIAAALHLLTSVVLGSVIVGLTVTVILAFLRR
jgi:hypothetical protein